MNRRDWLIASTAVMGSAVTMRFQQQKYSRDLRPNALASQFFMQTSTRTNSMNWSTTVLDSSI